MVKGKEAVMSDPKDIWLTTGDNPWNPFTQFESWYDFDERKMYRTCGKVAEKANYSHCLTDHENDLATIRAIEDVVDNDFVIDYVAGKVRHYYLVTPEDCVDF
jgi:hypothetical protein